MKLGLLLRTEILYLAICSHPDQNTFSSANTNIPEVLGIPGPRILVEDPSDAQACDIGPHPPDHLTCTLTHKMGACAR